MLRIESWNTFAAPWNVPVMVAGSEVLATASIASVACPNAKPGFSANEIVTDGNCPECGMLIGPARKRKCEISWRGTRMPEVDFRYSNFNESSKFWYCGRISSNTRY